MTKNIGFLSTRLAGTDGVSLETAKIAEIYRRLGHATYFCAGELDPDLPGLSVPEMHFTHPDILAIHDAAFCSHPLPNIEHRISHLAASLKPHLHRFVHDYQIDLLFIQNALAIPMNIPLGVALTDFIAETNLPALAHNHDLYWERERFLHSHIPEILERCFPPVLSSLRHIVINSLAQRELIRRKGVESVVLPNIFNFAQGGNHAAVPTPDALNSDQRQALGITDNHQLIIQPTRVIPRKGIELSIELVRRLRAPEKLSRLGKEPVLVISHHAGDEGVDYLRQLQHQAEAAGVPLLYAAEHFAPQRAMKNGQKIYSLWDAYVHADFVTYPSLLEGFGNALIETVYFRLPALVNHYEVYVKDIRPLGFDFVEIAGKITDKAVENCFQLLTDPARRQQTVEWNYKLARQHYSYEAVMPLLEALHQT